MARRHARAGPLWLSAGLVVAVAFLVVPATTAQSGSVGVTPATLALDDPPLLPGGSKVAVLTFQQQYSEPVQAVIDIVPRDGEWGDARAWLSLSESGVVTIPPGQHEVEVTVSVPSTAANGLYKAGVRFKVSPPGGGSTTGSGATTETAVTAVVEVVVDNENEVKRIAVDGSADVTSAEENSAFQVRVPLENTGNVDANPRIKIEVWDKLQTQVLRTYWFNSTMLKPGESGMYPFIVKSIDLPQDQYWAVVSVYLDGQLVKTLNQKTFDVLEPGALRRLAELRTITIGGGITRAAAGDLVKLTAHVRNTGQAPITAVFKGEVWRGGKLVDQLESDPLEIPIGEEGALDVIYTIPEPGKYEFKGRAQYGSKVTDEKTLLLNVEGGGEFPIAVVGGGAAAVLVIGGGAFLVVRSRKRRPPAATTSRRGRPPGAPSAKQGRPPATPKAPQRTAPGPTQWQGAPRPKGPSQGPPGQAPPRQGAPPAGRPRQGPPAQRRPGAAPQRRGPPPGR